MTQPSETPTTDNQSVELSADVQEQLEAVAASLKELNTFLEENGITSTQQPTEQEVAKETQSNDE